MQKAEIEEIQRSLDNIGPINLAVNDEYEKETERYNFLDDQYTDLEESEKIIEETISKLDGEAKTKFMDTFQKVQENFTKTYSTFFDGGEGYLRLVGEEDLLEAEIEIIAQPPGKKIRHYACSLLVKKPSLPLLFYLLFTLSNPVHFVYWMRWTHRWMIPILASSQRLCKIFLIKPSLL